VLCLAIGELMSTKKNLSGHLPHRKPLGFRETKTETKTTCFVAMMHGCKLAKPFVPSMNAPILEYCWGLLGYSLLLIPWKQWEKHNYCEFVNQTRGNPLRVYTHHWTKPCVWWFFSLWKMALLKIPVKLSGKTGSKMVQTYFNHKVPQSGFSWANQIKFGADCISISAGISLFTSLTRQHVLGFTTIFGLFDFVWFSPFCVCQTW
jgi:hypothetical protein